jgi:hypothetical protein
MAHMNNTETTLPKALRNVGFSGMRMVLASFSGLIVSVITVRSLGAQQMGNLSFILWFAGTIAALSSPGLPDAVGKFVAEHNSAGNHALIAKDDSSLFQTRIPDNPFAVDGHEQSRSINAIGGGIHSGRDATTEATGTSLGKEQV